MKVVVYTAIMVSNPAADKPIDMPGQFQRIPNWDYILLTNVVNAKQVFRNSGWSKGEIRTMEPPEDEMPDRNRRGWQIYAARWCKWHPHRLFPDYDYVIWIDGWQVPDFSKKDKWNELLTNIAEHPTAHMIHDKHTKNTCIYQEHQSIIFCEKDTYVNMLKVSKYIKTMGCPQNLGLFWTGCYIYKPGSNLLHRSLQNLWEDMMLYTYRDQALLMFEIWRNDAFKVWDTQPLSKLVAAVDTDGNHSGYLS
jgi:hypothetical protein